VSAEFGYTVENDKLTRSAGNKGQIRVACYPEEEVQNFGRAIELTVRVRLQLYLAYNDSPNEETAVDPGIIEAIGDRLRNAFKGDVGGTTQDLWFLHLTRIEYPDDPTGNKSRLEAEIQSRAANQSALP